MMGSVRPSVYVVWLLVVWGRFLARVAAKIYEKVWEMQFVGKSRRFMLDPAFGMMVLHCNGHLLAIQKLVKSYCKQLRETVPNKVNVVFVPVVLDGHWWCVAFSMNREEIVVIDSIETKKAAESRSVEVSQLAIAMDVAFQSMDPSWPIGTITNWPRTSLEMAQQGDIHSCGVHMIIAIKRNASKILKQMPPVEDLMVERSWLLAEDLLSEFNEARQDVLELITPRVLYFFLLPAY
uniref:Ubiquitin-like protease family profile domain-containing protein n=1 Tax=Chenopodium quinoa TaxID=63459 RepID=A0A803MR00_CHEQI